MKKSYILLGVCVVILGLLFLLPKSYAKDLDQILNYVVTVDPRMNDGTLDIQYEIKWKVLDSTTYGPLTWVEIGTPNETFDSATAITSNIKKIAKSSGSKVKIDFDRAYEAGEIVTFKYSIHQPYMHKISGNKCSYNFTPAWFTDAKVDTLIIRWNASDVIESDSEAKDNNYIVWKRTNMKKGEKVTINVKYNKNSFSYLGATVPKKTETNFTTIITILLMFIIIFYMAFLEVSSPGYSGRRGFYSGYRSRGCVRSGCACASSCACARSCACACAGSGRAGCSRKDFYGTKIETQKLNKVFNKNEK